MPLFRRNTRILNPLIMKTLFTLTLLFTSLSSFAQLRGDVTPEMAAGRVVDGTELTIDSLPYSRTTYGPFSIQVVPKNPANSEEITMVDAIYYQGLAPRTIPVAINQWNVFFLRSIPTSPANTTLFNNYRVFVGFGQNVKAY